MSKCYIFAKVASKIVFPSFSIMILNAFLNSKNIMCSSAFSAHQNVNCTG